MGEEFFINLPKNKYLCCDYFDTNSKNIIIMVHGFTGEKEEHGKFDYFKNKFLENKFDVFRFDFLHK